MPFRSFAASDCFSADWNFSPKKPLLVDKLAFTTQHHMCLDLIDDNPCVDCDQRCSREKKFQLNF